MEDIKSQGRPPEEKRMPHAKWELAVVEFTTANFDKVIPHSLNPVAAEDVKFEVMDRNAPGSLYRGAKAPGTDYIVLRSTVVGQFHIRLYIPAHYSQPKLKTTSYTPVTATNALLDGTVHTDTVAAAVVRGDIIRGNATPKWDRLAIGTGVLAGDGTDVTGWTKNPTLGTPVVDTLLNLTGGQIQFPASQNASAGANVLDDYEEGTWTPVLGGDGGTSGQTYSTQLGRYIKIGPLVIAIYRVTFSNKGTITGSLWLQGFPFASLNLAAFLQGHDCYEFTAFNTTWTRIRLRMEINSTNAYAMATAGVAVDDVNFLTGADVSNLTSLIGTMVYIAN